MLRARVDALKDGPCYDCDGTFPTVCMDFDHRDPNEKLFGVSDGVNGKMNWEKILAEIDKCDLVCANCHRIRTLGA